MEMTLDASQLEQLHVALPGRLKDTRTALKERMSDKILGRTIVREEFREMFDPVEDHWVSGLILTMIRA